MNINQKTTTVTARYQQAYIFILLFSAAVITAAVKNLLTVLKEKTASTNLFASFNLL